MITNILSGCMTITISNKLLNEMQIKTNKMKHILYIRRSILRLLIVFSLICCNKELSAFQALTVTISGSTSVCQGSQAGFTANVTNSSGTLTYQWKKNGTNISSDVTGLP